ncbi:MAG: hypothetical protein DAHOPDDO_02908 [Ignavibacteriaceae bacterium]|nr:hypothetical protein [Ignavibacteriaceae bacterium]
MTKEFCSLCGCELHRDGEYAKPTIKGRSHATKHHYVAERFFGRSKNRPGDVRDAIFNECPWKYEGQSATFCYDCHEELIHNPVFLPDDIQKFNELVKLRGLNEVKKTESKEKLGGRIILFHEIIENGLNYLLEQSNK